MTQKILHRKLTTTAVTLTEIMIVVVILGAIAAAGFRYYIKTMEQAHFRDAIVQLRAIHSANKIYQARNGQYWPASNGQNAAAISSALKLNIIEDGMTFTCDTGPTPGQTFRCRADRKTPAAAFRVQVTENALSSTNPECISGACP